MNNLVANSAQNWETIDMRDLMNKVNQAQQAKKWLFIWDKQGTVATFYKYQQRLCDLSNEMKAVMNGSHTQEMADEMLAYHIECVQGRGGNLLVDLGNCKANHFEKSFAKKADFEGGNLPSCQAIQGFPMKDFSIAMRCTVEEEKDMLAVLAQIPNSQDFNFVIVE